MDIAALGFTQGSGVSSRTNNMNERFAQAHADQKLGNYYPQLKTIIAVLCNVKVSTDIEILNFLMGKKSLEDCGYSESPLANQQIKSSSACIRPHLRSLRCKDTGLLEMRVNFWGEKEHFIKKEIADCLNEVLNGGYFGILRDKEGSADKLHELYLKTYPQSGVHGLDFKSLREKGTLDSSNLIDSNDLSLEHMMNNFAQNVSNDVSTTIDAGSKYDHQKFNQQLGSDVRGLMKLDEAKLSDYFTQFAAYLGVTAEQVPAYLKAHPITVVYDQELTNIATADNKARDGKHYPAPTLTHLRQLCALHGDANYQGECRLIKHGAITSMPGVFVFGANGYGEPDRENVPVTRHGENIHAIGLKEPHETTSISDYYKCLYINVIRKACNEGKIDCLILNGVGDGHFANNDTEKVLNAKARLYALIECKDMIGACDMKIILTDYAKNFKKISPTEFDNQLKQLEGIGPIILSGKDADLQGQTLASNIQNSQYVGLVNASDQLQYGCFFLELLGDHTVEERIWNQMFVGLHYDAIMAKFPNEYNEYITCTPVKTAGDVTLTI